MEIGEFLRAYRKKQKYSVREFAEMLDVSKFRLEKWEKGSMPNYGDGIKIKHYFRTKDFDDFSEDFLKNFDENKKDDVQEDLLTLKNQLLEEKDKRIYVLEKTISMLEEALAVYETTKKD